MYKSFVFIDFENIQEIDNKLLDKDAKIIILIGLNQEKKAFEFAKELLNNVSSIELIKVNGRGPNALDFFIAFYLGNYIEKINGFNIYICSNDTGYDPLINYLVEKRISIKRIEHKNVSNKIAVKNVNQANNKKSVQQKPKEIKKVDTKVKINTSINNKDYKKVLEYLKKQTKSQKDKRPVKEKTLITHLYDHFTHEIKLENIQEIVNLLKEKLIIKIENNKIKYSV